MRFGTITTVLAQRANICWKLAQRGRMSCARTRKKHLFVLDAFVLIKLNRPGKKPGRMQEMALRQTRDKLPWQTQPAQTLSSSCEVPSEAKLNYRKPRMLK